VQECEVVEQGFGVQEIKVEEDVLFEAVLLQAGAFEFGH